jgi:hypothetical protein
MPRSHPIWDDVPRLKSVAAASKTMTEMLSTLGFRINSGNFQTLKSRCLLYEIPIPQFDPKTNTVAATQMNKLSIDEMFSDRGKKVQGVILRKHLVNHFGVPDVCVKCGQLPVWQGEPLVLEVDHIDGNSFNNSIENLRILCGHCHSQTLNFRGRNIGNRAYGYCGCGKRVSSKYHRCRSCAQKDRQRLTKQSSRYPCITDLYGVYLEEETFVGVGRRFGVSDTAIRKHLKSIGVDPKDFVDGLLV